MEHTAEGGRIAIISHDTGAALLRYSQPYPTNFTDDLIERCVDGPATRCGAVLANRYFTSNVVVMAQTPFPLGKGNPGPLVRAPVPGSTVNPVIPE